MSETNPLIAGSREVSTPFTGTFLLEDGEALAQSIKDGDWVSGGLAALSTAADLVATISDPLGSLLAAGIGWVIEHLNPIKKWFNDLTGDAGQVAGFADTWANVARQVKDTAQYYRSRLRDVEAMSGETIRAYRGYVNDVANHLDLAGNWAQAISVGFEMCSTMVKLVHDMTRDALSQLAGMAISCAIELALTVGVASPLVIEQITTRLVALTEKIGARMTAMLTSMRRFITKIDELVRHIGDLRHLFDVIPGGTMAMAGARALPKGGRFNDLFLARANHGGGGGRPKKPAPASGQHIDPETRVHMAQADGDVSIEFKYGGNEAPEFNRQLKMQEDQLNLLTVDEYLKNREHYKEHGRGGKREQRAYRDKAIQEKYEDLREEGLSHKEATKESKKWAKDQVVLHGPDQVVGGFHDRFDGMGSRRVNSTIGGSWSSRVKELDTYVERIADGLSQRQLETTRLNVKLTWKPGK